MDRIEAVKQYKREGDFVSAVQLLYQMIEETEAESRQFESNVESWPYWQLAILHRKLKETESEVAILERFARQKQSGSKQSHKLMERLVKAYERAGQIEYREIDGVRTPFHSGQPIEQLDLFTSFGLVVDTETTGRTQQDELIEIALILFKFSKISGKILEIVDEYSGFRYPGCKIHPQAKRKHGLTPQHLKGQTLDDERVMGLFDQADSVLAHNAGFDRRYITQLYPSLYWKNWYCSMNGVPWQNLGFESKGQDALLEAHNIDVGRSHRAINDAKGLLQLVALENKDLGGTYFQAITLNSPLAWNESPSKLNRERSSRIPIKIEIKKSTPSRDGRKQVKKSTSQGWLVPGLFILACSLCSLVVYLGR
ncbi:MAG: hypothetical protein KDJ65_01570 [Anaerolineae bacterium]|nr:hypothetical protein [Anaerolineae bacterium]